MNIRKAFHTAIRVQNAVIFTRKRQNRHYRVQNHRFHTRNEQLKKMAIQS